jgi:hypothetical protein
MVSTWLSPSFWKNLMQHCCLSHSVIFAENNNATCTAYTLSLTHWLHATDAACWWEECFFFKFFILLKQQCIFTDTKLAFPDIIKQMPNCTQAPALQGLEVHYFLENKIQKKNSLGGITVSCVVTMTALSRADITTAKHTR